MNNIHYKKLFVIYFIYGFNKCIDELIPTSFHNNVFMIN